MTTTLAHAKAVVLAHHAALARAEPSCCFTTLSQHFLPDTLWRGMHPFHEQRGPQAVADAFWSPFLSAMSRVQRRQDVFFAGHNHLDEGGGTWVASMGHLMGLFDAPFLGIQPTRKIAMVRYAEFSRVEGDRIVEQALFVDLLHLMAQAGQYPLPGMTGAQLVQPGPLTHDGLLFDDQDAAVGQATLDRIHAMMDAINLANASATPPVPQDELARDWHDDMIWWGPTGIGATYTIDRYIEQHQRPFRTQLGARTFNGHICRMAEGNYGGFFGWPNLTMECTGPYMGLPPSGRKADMRVVDIYRRDGDKLAENWVFIDMLHFLNMQGLDVLAQLEVRKG
ncbi:ester cyclase [Tateyamaria omphalii]|uniref:Polyketide cyclase n=1 Tax=Tateyamaria omphalii TaxID=299262 RepID=A0A1P8MUB8_9RHOB|nr:ester cyclase [Tateyamaria omphalii]APX11592.1 polyketide cyclase [Tateyamaria omphalii]